MKPNQATWRLMSLLLILLLSTAVIVSTVSLNRPLAANFSQNPFNLSIMLMFYSMTFFGGLLGRLILSQHTVFLGCLFTLIGLTLLSLTNSLYWGTTLVIAGTSLLYVNLIHLCFSVGEPTKIRRILIALSIYLILLVSTYSYPLASLAMLAFGKANAYLMIGILSAIILFLYVFIEHFLINPTLTSTHSLTQYSYGQISGLILLTLMVLFIVHYSLVHIYATVSACIGMGLIVLGYLIAKKYFMWLFVVLILLIYWTNSSVHYDILHAYHHFPHTIEWRIYLHGITSTQLGSIGGVIVIALGCLFAAGLKWLPWLRKLSSYHVLLLGIYLAAFASFLPWLSTKLMGYSDHTLPWQLMLASLIAQSLSNLMVAVASMALCAQWFKGEQRLMMLGSITAIGGFALLCSSGLMSLFTPALIDKPHHYLQFYPEFLLALALLNCTWAILLNLGLKTYHRHTRNSDLYAAD